MAEYCFSGLSGVPASNGTYTESGVLNGRPMYTSANGSQIRFSPDSDDQPALWWLRSSSGQYLSQKYSDDLTPPLGAWAFGSLAAGACGGAAPAAPAAPSAVGVSHTQIVVTTSALPEGASSLTLQRSQDNSSFVTLGTGLAAGASFVDGGREANTSYFYRELAVNASGSTPGTSAVATTLPAPAPANFDAHCAKAVTPGKKFQVNLVWSAVDGATGYSIERAASADGPFVGIGIVGAVTEFSDLDIGPGDEWFYRMRASSAGAVYSPVVGQLVWTGGHIYFDRATKELVNDVTGTRRSAVGTLWLKIKNTRKDFKSAVGKLYRDLPKRPGHK